MCFVFMSIMLFFTAQARYSVKSDFRDSYMQYMTDDKAVVVWGKITKTEYKNGSYRFYLSDCTVAGKMSPDSEFSVCGSVILYCDEEAAKLGDYVRADGNVKLFSSATNEGEFDRKAFYSSQGIDFGLKNGKIKAKLPEDAWFYHGLQRLRDNMSEALIDVTDDKGFISGDGNIAYSCYFRTPYINSRCGYLQASKEKRSRLFCFISFCDTSYIKLCCNDRKCCVYKARGRNVYSHYACGCFRTYR